jgi:hypothetical protein
VRLILSRKGFDSSSGGCPSPIFPDGSMISLPIPDKRSPIRYSDLTWRGRNLGDVVARLTRKRHRRDHFAHLDPDLREGLLPRVPGWRPALGQHGAAQGHLHNQNVGAGDLFVFWGLFRPVDPHLGWAGPPEHRIWGWLQVGRVANVDADVRDGPSSWEWANRHPHLAFEPDPSNTLYVAAERLRLPGAGRVRLPGAGTFDVARDVHRLTDARAARPSLWSLPHAFLPSGRPALSYHDREQRWSCDGDRVLLQSVARGQEFVLDLDEYPDVVGWVSEILAQTDPQRT